MNTYSRISIVIIGLNVEKFLNRCIDSILNTTFPTPSYEIIYIDSGSSDRSIAIAESYDQVQVIFLNDPHPTPGRARNSGWKAAKYELIQFLDADTILHPNWITSATKHLKGNIIAVCGNVNEIKPKRNFFHLIGQIEWNCASGYCTAFGGIVLMKKEPLITVGGYDENLIAGEDPELSYRLRERGGKIWKLDIEMVKHDLNMSSIQQYFKRSFRTGHAFAEIAIKLIKKPEKLWLRELLRIPLQVGLPWFILLTGYLLGYSLLGVLFAIFVFFRPLLKIFRFQHQYGLTFNEALVYALHLSIVVYPQCAGVLRYLYGQISGSKLKNQRH